MRFEQIEFRLTDCRLHLSLNFVTTAQQSKEHKTLCQCVFCMIIYVGYTGSIFIQRDKPAGSYWKIGLKHLHFKLYICDLSLILRFLFQLAVLVPSSGQGDKGWVLHALTANKLKHSVHFWRPHRDERKTGLPISSGLALTSGDYVFHIQLLLYIYFWVITIPLYATTLVIRINHINTVIRNITDIPVHVLFFNKPSNTI